MFGWWWSALHGGLIWICWHGDVSIMVVYVYECVEILSPCVEMHGDILMVRAWWSFLNMLQCMVIFDDNGVVILLMKGWGQHNMLIWHGDIWMMVLYMVVLSQYVGMVIFRWYWYVYTWWPYLNCVGIDGDTFLILVHVVISWKCKVTFRWHWCGNLTSACWNAWWHFDDIGWVILSQRVEMHGDIRMISVGWSYLSMLKCMVLLRGTIVNRTRYC